MATAVQRPAARLQLGILASLLGLAALAWLLTDARMLGMDAGPGADPGGLGFYVLSWVVMMSAMMFPSIAPMVLTFGFLQRRRSDRGTVDHAVSSGAFVAGYLLTWTAFGLLAYGLYVGVRSLAIPELSWNRGGRYLAGGVILAAAIYQVTPMKDACLGRCRAPLDFVLTRWRDGPSGALRMGIVHGAWCVGCCWALMAALFALGVMSLTWMVVVAGLIAVASFTGAEAQQSNLPQVTIDAPVARPRPAASKPSPDQLRARTALRRAARRAVGGPGVDENRGVALFDAVERIEDRRVNDRPEPRTG